MQFLIADTFTDSLARLTAAEQKAVKTSAFDMQVDPSNPGLKLHRLDRAKDKNFWSARAGRDLRIVVHKSASAFVLCFVGHHDKAYAWAERRRLETHPQTGAAQIVEFRERVEEIVVRREVAEPPAARYSDEQLLFWGIPTDWLDDIRAADEDELLQIAERLPQEAAEALLEIATGGSPRIDRDSGGDSTEPSTPSTETAGPFTHPAAQRRFRVVDGVEELERALEFPWDRWMVFLHPDQRSIVERDWGGPVRVRGSAGTGKTVVALHRAVFLARRSEDSRVLLTTFSSVLAGHLEEQLRRLIGNEPRVRERIDVMSIDDLARNLAAGRSVESQTDVRGRIHQLYARISETTPVWFSAAFAVDEWHHVVDNHAIVEWEQYRDFRRLGRKKRLAESKRKALWDFYETLRSDLGKDSLTTWGQLYASLEDQFLNGRRSPYDHIVADEAQDISPTQLRFLSALAGEQDNGLFFSGDVGQRIFRQPFSWSQLGVDVRGRSKILRVNYRTSHQIRRAADRLLETTIADPDGDQERRDGTVSVFNGPVPEVMVFDSQEEEINLVATWVQDRVRSGTDPASIGLVVRSTDEIPRAQSVISRLNIDTGPRVITMHEAKGLEFSAVAVIACDDDVIPSLSRIESIGDEGDLEEVYTTERHLLYVACTRARDNLLVSGVDPGSEFLEDMNLSIG